jgi:hypothetical protein
MYISFWNTEWFGFFFRCSKYLKKQKEKIHFGSWFQRFGSWSTGFIALVLRQGRNIMTVGGCGGNCSLHSIQEAERENRKDWDQVYLSRIQSQ